MAVITQFLADEHHCCDESFATVEEAAQTGFFGKDDTPNPSATQNRYKSFTR